MIDDLPEEMTTSQALDHTLQAYGRLERKIGEVRRERDRYRNALSEITGQDPVENALDPQWAARIAAAALDERRRP